MEYRLESNRIIVSLPLTTHTGSVRVKRPNGICVSSIVATVSGGILEGDYIEWQIGYDTNKTTEPSVILDKPLLKPKGTFYGYDLTRLLYEAIRIRLIEKEELAEIRDLLFGDFGGIEEQERILKRVVDNGETSIGERFGFTRYEIVAPNYHKLGHRYSVEIKVWPQQRASRDQAMIYLNLPIAHFVSQNNVSLIGRKAQSKEKADYVIDNSNKNLIIDTLLAFVIASKDHRNNIRRIFTTFEL